MAQSGGWIKPMKATIGTLPTGDEWAFELKWDGMRIEALCRPENTSRPETQGRVGDGHDALVLRSLSGRDVTSSYPELLPLPAALATSAVLDGEVVVFDGDRPSFGRLQHRMHVERPTQPLVTEHPVVYVVFDLLELDGRSLLDLPLRSRRDVLTQLLDDGPSWRVPPIVEGDGEALLTLADKRGLEGVVAKRLSSRYEPGARSSAWRKVKIRRRQEFVVVGWLPGQGRLSGEIGSLLLAVNDGAHLVFVGAVGSGIGDRDRAQLAERLVPTGACPFDDTPALDRPPIWTEPTVVAEVDYGSWPADALLRHPVYAGLRIDRDPTDIVRELPP